MTGQQDRRNMGLHLSWVSHMLGQEEKKGAKLLQSELLSTKGQKQKAHGRERQVRVKSEQQNNAAYKSREQTENQ